MSGFNEQKDCPICGNSINIYSDWKPVDYISGECIYCGLSFYTKYEQMGLTDINNQRQDYNDNCDNEADKLPMLEQKDLDKFTADIKDLY